MKRTILTAAALGAVATAAWSGTTATATPANPVSVFHPHATCLGPVADIVVRAPSPVSFALVTSTGGVIGSETVYLAEGSYFNVPAQWDRMGMLNTPRSGALYFEVTTNPLSDPTPPIHEWVGTTCEGVRP